MRIELDIWAAKRDTDVLQPLLLTFAQLTSDTDSEGFKKFVNIRRKLGLYVNMAVITPLLIEHAKKITLWDSKNMFLGNITDKNSLPQLITSNFERINFQKLGVLRVLFKDDSYINFPVPNPPLPGFDPANSTFIEY